MANDRLGNESTCSCLAALAKGVRCVDKAKAVFENVGLADSHRSNIMCPYHVTQHMST